MEDQREDGRKNLSPSCLAGSNIVRKIMSFMQATAQKDGRSGYDQGRQFDCMVDVGCGDGSSTMQFIPHFRSVTGIDKSKAQISKANEYGEKLKSDKKQNGDLSFEIASGERMPFKDETMDLVCFSRSFHWMESMSTAVRESRRILKPGGCLAMYCTGFPRIRFTGAQRQAAASQAEIVCKTNQLVESFFRQTCEMHPRCRLAVDDKYQRIYDAIIVDNRKRKGSKFIVVDDQTLAITKTFVTLREFREMARSYAGYKCAVITMRKNSEWAHYNNNPTTDPLDDLLTNLRRLWDMERHSFDDIFVTVTWDVSLVLSTRPVR